MTSNDVTGYARSATGSGPSGSAAAPSPIPAQPSGDPRWEVSEAASRFRVGSHRLDADAVRTPMAVGSWTVWPDGRPCAGSLGVVLDDALGFSVFRARPPDTGAVTTEISVDVVAPGPWSGAGLVAVGRLLAIDDIGGLAACEVVDDRGAIVATGTARCQFVPVPRAAAAAEAGHAVMPTVEPPAVYGVLDLLGARQEPGETTARIVVDRPAPLSNGLGMVHGGVLFCLSEMAATALTRPGPDAVAEQTMSVRLNLLRPARIDEPLVVTADVLHRSRSVTVSRVTASGMSGKPYTAAHITRRQAGGPARRV